MARLSTGDHPRDGAGLVYVYPVLSRRAGGLSIGVNLNVNNACNWRCVYCQVPGLARGGPPPVDLVRLERELEGFLDHVLEGDFFAANGLPAASRVIRDIAFSGNGEPTSAHEFPEALALVSALLRRRLGGGPTRLVVISNGSLVHLPRVHRALADLPRERGELWFKLDSATDAGRRRINDASIGSARARANLLRAAHCCPTWVQTCVFALDGEPPPASEQRAYLGLLGDLLAAGAPLRGVLLYGFARPSHQPEAPRLAALEADWLEEYALRIRALGLPVKVTP